MNGYIYVSLHKPPGPKVNRFTGVISRIKDLFESIRLVVHAGSNQLLAEMPRHTFESMGLVVGQEVFLILKLAKIKVCEGGPCLSRFEMKDFNTNTTDASIWTSSVFFCKDCRAKGPNHLRIFRDE